MLKAVLVAVLVLGVVVGPVWADGEGGEIPTFDGWLVAASGPLVSVIVGFLISVLADVWPAYKGWPAKGKRYIYWGLCLVAPVGAASLRAGLGYVAWSFDPLLWHAIWYGALAAGLGTVVHMRKSAVARKEFGY